MELSQVIDEIKRIPPSRLSEVYNFIHFFRLGLELETAQADDNQKEPPSGEPQPANQYNFSDLAGRLTWQGDALTAQRTLRDEW
ncbi:hypothetical protein [Leptolyngbya iicbica]|uniref:DUF2281 domain-containing protein n=2 Tax=Cyanophyceae TaxID=3028117 RepID=A0A4Q7E3K4_9CYAN|nr:hypothetical protein [Leptolyngbya sp. LK]RZM77256.1 hypothetical protein DYY88_16550 [Leptolyngbya sp. LK]